MFMPKLATRKPTFAASAMAFLLLAVGPVGSATSELEQLSAAKSAADANAESAEGKKFGKTIGLAIGRDQQNTIRRCAKEGQPAEVADFTLFLRVDGVGVVDKALVRPASRLAACARDKLVGGKVSAPPHAAYWVEVGVNFESN